MNGKACCSPSNTSGAKPPPLEQLIRVNMGSTECMVKLPGGAFHMGTDDPEAFPDDGEGPIREVQLAPFWVDTTAVTNRQFDAFVRDTHYKTEAEKFGWSFVFYNQLPEKKRGQLVRDQVMDLEWWCRVDGADWRHPEGPGSHVKKRGAHPVLHVSWQDAAAFAAWAGKRLPTEAEYEYAARGGLEQKRYPWGDDLTPFGKHRCNIWQGNFPYEDMGDDGFTAPGPANAFSPNGYGLYNMSGNAWEWCLDWWSPVFHIKGPRENPFGPTRGERKVMRGGSFLCHDSYCNRYRVGARTSNTPGSSTSNISFRCVRD
jgi:formylglycine-generating enzyme